MLFYIFSRKCNRLCGWLPGRCYLLKHIYISLICISAWIIYLLKPDANPKQILWADRSWGVTEQLWFHFTCYRDCCTALCSAPVPLSCQVRDVLHTDLMCTWAHKWSIFIYVSQTKLHDTGYTVCVYIYPSRHFLRSIVHPKYSIIYSPLYKWSFTFQKGFYWLNSVFLFPAFLFPDQLTLEK